MVIFLWHDMAFLLMSSFLDLFDFMKKTLNLKLFFWYLLRYLFWALGWLFILRIQFKMPRISYRWQTKLDFWCKHLFSVQLPLLLLFCISAAALLAIIQHFIQASFLRCCFRFRTQIKPLQLSWQHLIYNWSYCLFYWNQTRA